MKINVIAVGKLKERYWQDACAEYMKRLSAYCDPQVTEIRESALRAKPSDADEDAVRLEEGREILKRIRAEDYVITLEIKGKSLDSEELALNIERLGISGRSSVAFVIGGSLGLSMEVSERADLRLSFSAMTFPHQMMRVILLEQIYRSFKIIRGETYHK